MKRKHLLKSMLLLCALIAGSSVAWGQTDYSAVYTSSSDFSSVITGSKVTIGSTNYDAVKKGTGKAAGSVTLTVPKDTKYLHLHVAGWSGESVSLSISPDNYSSTTSISLTADSEVSGSGTTYDVDDTKCSTDYYKVITFNSALASDTPFTFTATGGKRFVMWGVNSEVASTDPSSEATFSNKTPSITYPATKTYSQEPTTAIGYSGTITYSMTENTAGATINSETGLVTVTKGGSVTVKAIAAAVAGYSSSEDSYTLTVNDSRATAGLSWSALSANVTFDADDNVFPTLSNPNSLPVSYTSSNEAAATIDGSGVITLKDVTATTTISAVFAGDDDYKDQTVTYELNVTKAPFSVKDGFFDFVEAKDASEDYGSGITPTSDGSHYDYDEATWVAGNVSMKTAGKYRWWSADGTLRLYNNSPASSATFSVPGGYVITKIVSTGGNFATADKGTLTLDTWTGSEQNVKLSISTSTVNFKTITITYERETVSVTVTSAGWASFSNAKALDFTGTGVTAYIAKEKDASKVTLTEIAKVPAETGIVVSAAAGTYAIPVLTGAADATTGNLLKAWLTAGTPSETKYYTLAAGPSFKLSSGGTLAANKSYLVLPGGGAPSLDVDIDDNSADDQTTGISAIEHSTLNIEHSEVYNLSGQRVSQPTKGLYIVNGKKVVVK